MTYEEVRGILKILKVNYPQSFRGWDREQGEDFLNLWAEAFKDDPSQLVAAAVKSIIYSDSREFAPNIGQVKEVMYKLTHKDELTEQEAFELIRKAASKSLWWSKEEHAKLPPILQKMVTPNQLKDWAKLSSDEFNTVVASNFMRSYKQRMIQQKEHEKLPDAVRQLLDNREFVKRIE